MLIEGNSGKARLLLAHGAGAGQSSEFLVTMSALLADNELEVVRFNFPYMEQITCTGKRRPPDRLPTLLSHYEAMIAQQDPYTPLYIAGKSMGGRVATMLAEHPRVQGVFVMGYPFHPVGKSDNLRIDHLRDVQTPVTIFQGTRDPFGKPEEVSSYPLSKAVSVHWLADGDHDLKPRKASGFTQNQHMQSVAQSIRLCVLG